MASSPVVKATLTFRDRDGNQAAMTCYCSFAVSIVDAWGFALAVAAKVAPLSNAALIGVQIAYRWRIDAPAAPAEASSIERKLLLLMVDDDEKINGMMIPSPKTELWETTGNYTGIRLDMAGAGALVWIDMLSNVELFTKSGQPLGLLVVGGLAL